MSVDRQHDNQQTFIHLYYETAKFCYGKHFLTFICIIQVRSGPERFQLTQQFCVCERESVCIYIYMYNKTKNT